MAQRRSFDLKGCGSATSSGSGKYPEKGRIPTPMTILFDDISALFHKHCLGCSCINEKKSPKCKNLECEHNKEITRLRKQLKV